MNRKMGILVLCLFLLSGCSVTYNLDIDSNGIFKESIEGKVNNSEINEEDRGDETIYSYLLYSATPLIDEEGVYDKVLKDRGSRKEFLYSYTFNGDYYKSNALNNCFNDPSFKEDDEYYYIDLKGPFTCLFSDKVVVNVTSNLGVVEDNADKISDNTYTWVIDKEDTSLRMVLAKNIIYPGTKEKKGGSFKIVCLVILVVLAGIALFLYKKKDSNDI